MRVVGHWVHGETLFWFGEDGVLGVFDSGHWVEGSWRREGSAIWIDLGDGQGRLAIVRHTERGLWLLPPDDDVMRLVRVDVGWSAQDLREQLTGPWRQLYCDLEPVWFRPWAPTREHLDGWWEEIDILADGAVLAVNGEGERIVFLGERLLITGDGGSSLVWGRSDPLPEDGVAARREALRGRWRVAAPHEALIGARLELGDEAVLTSPKTEIRGPWELQADGRHVVIDESVAVLDLGGVDGVELAVAEGLRAGGNVWVREGPAVAPERWHGVWFVQGRGQLDADVLAAYRTALDLPQVVLVAPVYQLARWTWTPRDAIERLELHPDGRLDWDGSEGRWSVTEDGRGLTLDGEAWEVVSEGVLTDAEGRAMRLGRTAPAPWGPEVFVGRWRVASWGEAEVCDDGSLPEVLELRADGACAWRGVQGTWRVGELGPRWVRLELEGVELGTLVIQQGSGWLLRGFETGDPPRHLDLLREGELRFAPWPGGPDRP